MPQISVKLVKTSKDSRGYNQRYQGGAGIELAPYLQEGSSVTTTKSISSPHNSFTIRVGDRLPDSMVDSLYGLVEPMDALEIRMSRDGAPQMVMRGLVTDVHLDETINGNNPNRSVIITGGDSGRFFHMLQIHSLKGTPTTEMYLGMAGQFMKDKHNIPFMELTAIEFIDAIFNEIINAHIAKIGNSALPPFSVDTSGADPVDKVYPFGFQSNPDGTMWSHIVKHGNIGPFYECLVEDTEGGVDFIYRKPALKTLSADGSGSYIFPATSAGEFIIPPVDIATIRSSRGEHDVANWYFVQSGKGGFDVDMDTKLRSLIDDGSKLSKAGYPNCQESLYGFRSMEVTTWHGSYVVRGMKEDENKAASNSWVTYLDKQIELLQNSNVDNVVFESGSITCKGFPEYKPGNYFRTQWRSGLLSTGYIQSVTHTFEPFRSYTCTLNFIRGTGFANRTGQPAPYHQSKGVYA